MSHREVEVVVAGLATVDLIARPVHLGSAIEPGGLQPIDVVEMATGGFVCNVSRALAKLGISVAAISDVGDDALGNFVLSTLQAAGVHASSVTVHSHKGTATTVVLVDPSGERSFLFASGVGRQFRAADIWPRMNDYPKARWLLFGYYSLFAEVDRQLADWFREAKRRGLKTALDAAGTGGDGELLRTILPHVDCYFPSENEARRQTGCQHPREMIERFRQSGAAGILGIKLGPQGALVSTTPGVYVDVPALASPATIVDTTGAGDAFLAGFIAGCARGLDEMGSLRLAAATSACCVQGLGASSGIKDWDATCQLAEGIRIDPYGQVG